MTTPSISKYPNFDLTRFSKIRCFFGLGNPGSKFAKTRHNAGAMLVDFLVSQFGLSYNEHHNLLFAEAVISEEKFYFVKSLTFMNNSGEVLLSLKKKFGLDYEQILVIHDELEREIGKASFGSGSSKGHNGVKSILENSGGYNFLRLRIGISRPTNKLDVPKYVLEKFSATEQSALQPIFESTFAAFETILARN